eukprot:9288361-Pyramimonas_sp.AAC.1
MITVTGVGDDDDKTSGCEEDKVGVKTALACAQSPRRGAQHLNAPRSPNGLGKHAPSPAQLDYSDGRTPPENPLGESGKNPHRRPRGW